MAEWVVGPIMDKIINACSDYLEDQVRSQTSMKKELERLRENHPKIQAVVFAANQAQISDQNPALNKWIWQLRDAIDEADDMLDEFEYMKHKEQLAKNTEETKKRKVTSFLFESAHKILKFGEGVLKIDLNLNRLEEAVQKLDKVSAEVGTFLHLLESTKQEQHEQELEFYKTRETGSLPKNDLIGRGKDKEFLMQWLRKPSNEEHQALINGTDLYRNISLLSIVGHGGMGKSTLLQHVYEDEMTNEFDLKMWVCVSNNFDVKKVIADMLESLKMNRPPLDSLDALQKNLKSEMMSKKFLLVLDDIWESDEERDKSKWENVLAPLAYGSFGSRILVTTRMDSVALMIAKVIKKKNETFRLEGLEENECLQLLNSHAFADVENPNDYKRLKSIAGEIVKKLSGSPLAAKVTGGVLNSSLDEKHWTKVLNSDFVSAKLGQDSIFLILRLSYMFLPKYLQSCFAFCCLFPQNHGFDKDDLVRMWIALGFIQPSHIQGETMEDVGGRYFDVLVKKSFFDKFQWINKRTFYKMHDLLHELAQSVSKQECLRVVDSTKLPSIIPETIRHLSVKTRNLDVLRKIENLKNLHTLCITYGTDGQDFIDVLAKIFKTSKSIRLLSIDFSSVKMIPEVIGYLIHLRYLRLCYTSVNMLPRSLSNLYHLQFIIIRDRWLFSIRNDFLPRDINNLSNLHYLELPWDSFPGICEIGKLKSLQELNGFYLRNESGYRIGELKFMNDLRKLRIKFLENVKDAEEACSIKLCDKKNLTNLSLEWGDIDWRNLINLYETVLDNIQPQNCLKNLSIRKYMGARSAIWMNNARSIYNIEYISLENCMEWQNLPPFGKLPFLKFLQLRYMPKVKQIDNKFQENDKFYVFPSLEVLKIEGLDALEDWFDKGVAAAANGCLFPCLTELKLKDCPKLEELPSLPPKLKSLIIDNIGWKTLNCCSMTNSIPLISLVASHCPDITYIPLARLAALRYLTIKDCPNLISLGGHQEVETADNCQLILKDLIINDPSVLLMEPLRSITSLKNLTIERNDELVSFSNETEQWFLKISSSLCVLVFTYLHSLQSLPSSLSSLSSLKSLYVRSVTQLRLLPNIPTSLEQLELRHLESLQYLPSSLSTISSLKNLDLEKIPLLKSLPDLPPSLCKLSLSSLENMDCLPSSLPTLSSLQKLYINETPQLRGLPELPSSLYELCLCDLSNLYCLPSCLPNLTSLHRLNIHKTPQLRELPDLPPSLKFLTVRKCHPELKERYRMVEGSDWHKIAHIPKVDISAD